jgi:glyoxylase-like metal-dependent hydrolase (beta-lactamase superfamily II)
MRGGLLVDDHAAFRSFARGLIKAAGYLIVAEAADGAAALLAAATKSVERLRKMDAETVYPGHGKAFDFARLKFRAQVGSDRRSETAHRLPDRRLEVLVDRIRPTTSCRDTPVRRVATANVSNVSGPVRSAPHRGG